MSCELLVQIPSQKIIKCKDKHKLEFQGDNVILSLHHGIKSTNSSESQETTDNVFKNGGYKI